MEKIKERLTASSEEVLAYLRKQYEGFGDAEVTHPWYAAANAAAEVPVGAPFWILIKIQGAPEHSRGGLLARLCSLLRDGFVPDWRRHFSSVSEMEADTAETSAALILAEEERLSRNPAFFSLTSEGEGLSGYGEFVVSRGGFKTLLATAATHAAWLQEGSTLRIRSGKDVRAQFVIRKDGKLDRVKPSL